MKHVCVSVCMSRILTQWGPQVHTWKCRHACPQTHQCEIARNNKARQSGMDEGMMDMKDYRGLMDTDREQGRKK